MTGRIRVLCRGAIRKRETNQFVRKFYGGNHQHNLSMDCQKVINKAKQLRKVYPQEDFKIQIEGSVIEE